MEKRMKRWFKKDRNGSDMLLFHHRFPTSTINVKRAAHPFNTGDYFGNVTYVLVHNGVISNPKDLKTAHEAEGIKYQSILQDGTYNDSEALLWDFALTMEGKQDGLKAYGGIAFICIKLVDGELDKLYFGRNYGRPLNLFRVKEGMMLSSEGEGEEIDVARLYTYNYALKRLTTKYFKIPSYDASTYSSNWDTYNYPTKYTNNACGYGAVDDDGLLYDSRGYAYYPEDYAYDGKYADDFDYYDEGTGVWQSAQITHAPIHQKPTVISDILTKPTATQVNAFLFKQIGLADGSYDGAYWALETLYSTYKKLDDTVDNLRSLKLVEGALDALMQDSNYIDEDSYHPLWVGPQANPDGPTQEQLTKAIGG